MSCRPWEVVLCAQCEPQEPLMREVGLGDTGLQRLFHALKVLPRPWSQRRKCRRHMVDILGALQHLSQYSWLSDAVAPGLMDLWTNLCRYFVIHECVLFKDLRTCMAEEVSWTVYSWIVWRHYQHPRRPLTHL